MAHRNAPLTEAGRLRLARRVADDGWPLRRAAERFQVSHTTAAQWAARYRDMGGRDGGPVVAAAFQPAAHAGGDRAADRGADPVPHRCRGAGR